MSDSAPVVMSLNTSSSAARPPSATLICASRCCCSKLNRSASGAENVTPSAWPRGMIETLRTGSAPGVSIPTIAWPASWYAVRRRSSSEIITLRSAPSTIRSSASVRSSRLTFSCSRRAASSAASLTRFSRSAPTMPGVVGGERAEVDVGGERNPARVHAQDRLAAGAVRRRDDDAAVEPPRAQQRRVEDLRPVGRAEHDHAQPRIEPVHLGEDLVERLLALVVAAGDVRRRPRRASGRWRRARR